MDNDRFNVVGTNISEKASMIWNVADGLVGPFKPHEYGTVILPMTVIKRFHDCLLPTRDAVLAWFQKALDGEVPEYTADAGIRYQKNLTNTCLKLIEEVPGAGVYIYANPCRDVDLDPALGLTQHTILAAENIIESGENRPSVMQWLWDCVHGRTSKVGLELLG